jgi:hypothetical protein
MNDIYRVQTLPGRLVVVDQAGEVQCVIPYADRKGKETAQHIAALLNADAHRVIAEAASATP